MSVCTVGEREKRGPERRRRVEISITSMRKEGRAGSEMSTALYTAEVIASGIEFQIDWNGSERRHTRTHIEEIGHAGALE